MELSEQNDLMLTAQKIERHLRAIYIAVYWSAICGTVWAVFEMAQSIGGFEKSTAEWISGATCLAFAFAAHHAKKGRL